MKISLTESRKEMNKNTRRFKLMMMLFVANLMALSNVLAQRDKGYESSDSSSLYFGQKPPGLTPEIFAPGIVSINGRSESSISFSSDLDEIYFGAKSKNEKPAIYFSKLEGNEWAPIKKAAFTKGKRDQEETAFVSHNGKRIYFTAFSSDHSDTRIWYVDRLEDSWSDAVKLDLHNDDKVLLESHTKKGDIYYYNFSKRKSYYAAYSNGSFPEPKEFEFEPGFFHPFFSQNEDYLVAHGPNKEDQDREDSDIYVSFKKQDGTWATPINLGSAVNSNMKEGNPTISPDGKYLFFSRNEADGTANVYWVSTEIIQNLRPR